MAAMLWLDINVYLLRKSIDNFPFLLNELVFSSLEVMHDGRTVLRTVRTVIMTTLTLKLEKVLAVVYST